jgi:hypothetical protein
MNALDRIDDRLEIEHVLKLYCRAVDRSDWALLESCFHPEASVSNGAFAGTVEDFIPWSQARRPHLVHSFHVLAGVLPEFADEETAVVEMYTIGSQRFRAPAETVEAGNAEARVLALHRRVDRFEKRHGRWRIAATVTIYGDRLVQQLPDPVEFPSGNVVQQPTTADALYAILEDPYAI